MGTDDNKQIFARNLKRYMERKGVTIQQVCDALGFKYTTVMDWTKAVTYPRMPKVELLAEYFGCLKSDLIEDKPMEHLEMKEKNDTLTDVVKRMRNDKVFSEAVLSLYPLDTERLKGLLALLK